MVCFIHIQTPKLVMPCMQGFAPWPADKLHVIGGGRRAYFSSEADPTEQAGREARQTAEEVGAERRARAQAAFKGHPQIVQGERRSAGLGAVWRAAVDGVSPRLGVCWLSSTGRLSVTCLGHLGMAGGHLAPPGAPWCISAVSSAPRLLLLRPADLIASTDPAAITEHGQFYREEADCQVCGCGGPSGQCRGCRDLTSFLKAGKEAQGAGPLALLRICLASRLGFAYPTSAPAPVSLSPPPLLQVYARGRVALVGDAAHLATPFLGQGASQAIEDALELGRAVGEQR